MTSPSAAAKSHACTQCDFVARNAQGLAGHVRLAHGPLSTHPANVAKRRVRSRGAPIIEYPDGPIALLEAVIFVARHDARRDAAARDWLHDLRQIRRINRLPVRREELA